ncbi:MAG: helix-turn-helix domain-containing protein [Acidimicrobiia bacterium]
MSAVDRRRALMEAGLLHPNPAGVTAALFDGSRPFFLTDDKVQVKYEMLRTHVVDGLAVKAAAELHGYSRAAFYLVQAAFAERGMAGLMDDRRGRPVKVTRDIASFLAGAEPSLSPLELTAEVARRFGVSLHPRTLERARRR